MDHVNIPARPYPYAFPVSKTALVIIDMQKDFLLPGGFGEIQGANLERVQKTIAPTLAVLQLARQVKLPVIHTREGHEPDLSDVPRTKLTRQAASPSGKHDKVIGDVGPAGSRLLIRGEEWHDIVEELRPIHGEILLDKPGKGAFYDTALHQTLINLGISHLIMCGVTTECCLTTTAREANDRGFEVCVLQDCTDGYVKDFWEPSINMLSFSDGLFGFTALSTDLRDGLLPLVKKEEKEEKKKWDGKLGIAYLTGLYAEGSLTPDEVIKEVYRRLALASADSAVWLAKVKEEDALKEAKRLEKEFKDPSNRPPLYGIPFSVKDSIDVAGMPTTGACPAYAYTPTVNAPTVSILLSLGAILIGKVNLDQLATGLVGMRSPYGQPSCVFDTSYVSGGSSSGSCVSVASHQVSFSLATDTAGSGRVPAMFNGIIGFKGTRGCLSTTGVVPCCRSLDCIAIEALSVPDVRKVWSLLHKFDPSDPFAKVAIPSWALSSKAVLQPGQKFRFAIPPKGSQSRGYLCGPFEELFEEAVERLQKIGGELVETVDYTVFEEAGKLLYEGSFVAERVAGVKEWWDAHPAPAEGSSEPDVLLPEIRAIYSAAATKFTAADAWNDALQMMVSQRKCQEQFAGKNHIDVLVVPTAPLHPTKDEYNKDPIGLNHRLGKFTHYANILDMCGAAIPAGFTKNKMPFGITFLGQSFTDGKILEIADRFHRDVGLPTGLPNLPV